MAAKRVWFPNLPSNGVDELDRSQRAIGISRAVSETKVCDYYRRYLNDMEVVPIVGPPVTFDTGTDNADSTYLRRYLNDVVL